jgi:alpha-beta hydrolase superfamily lysophospholipase
LQDIALMRTQGRNAFGNAQVRYRGSADDAALNAAVLRYPADPAAVARFAEDTDLTGRIAVPVLTVHAINDPTVFVEQHSTLRQTFERAGNGARLVQTYSDHSEHSYLSDPTYVALFDALLQWVDKGVKPTPASVAAGCQRAEAAYGAGCRIRPDYQPAPLEARVAPRQ